MIIVRGQDRFHIDFVGSKLWRVQDRGREEIHLTPKAWGVLQYLADRPSMLVRKNELLSAIWGVQERYEASLTKIIRELRLALDDNPNNPAFIETVHGRGFLFIAEIEKPPSQTPPIADAGKPTLTARQAAASIPLDAITAPHIIDSAQIQDNDTVMRTLRKWERRPGSCAGQELIGIFEVENCSSAEVPCARALSLPPGDLVEVTLYTPKGLHTRGEYTWFYVNAIGPQAEFFEEIADKKDRSTVVVHMLGYGTYICRRDFPDLDTGKMQHFRDPKPAVLVLSAKAFPDHEVTVDDRRSDPTSVQWQPPPVDNLPINPVTSKKRDAIRAQRNKRLVATLEVCDGITGCRVFQLEDHSDKGYLIRVKFDPEKQTAAVVSGLVRQTLDSMTPHVPFWGELMSESDDSVSFGYSYIDEYNKVFKS